MRHITVKKLKSKTIKHKNHSLALQKWCLLIEGLPGSFFPGVRNPRSGSQGERNNLPTYLLSDKSFMG